ncbi:MAG TPA: hypothetical protein VFI25_17965 [Planctomycetota bacterium]|nr:hypothetical protein [Planctomycetota bacterium]
MGPIRGLPFDAVGREVEPARGIAPRPDFEAGRIRPRGIGRS